MQRIFANATIATLAVLLIGGCASGARQLMPTPALYQLPEGRPVFDQTLEPWESPDLDLLYLTDRSPKTDPESTQPYGQEKARRIAFGTAQVRVVPGLDWEALREQSRLAERTREVNLELGQVQEIGAFPEEPYLIGRAGNGPVLRDRQVLAHHAQAKTALRDEIRRRIARTPRREVLLYVHGFNETFATAAYTAAELCHFLGREQVCAFFTWPASSSGGFLTSYVSTTESAEYAVEHLKKSLRVLATTPGVEGTQILAHSRGTALTLRAVRELAVEAIAAGKNPADLYRIKNLVLLSPDIDVDIAGQGITSFLSDPDLVALKPDGRLPRVLKGRLTVYASPNDEALAVSRILFRSRHRAGQLLPEDVPEGIQRHFETLGSIDLITYDGKRTDTFGHSYFATNPQVSSDLIQLIRCGKQLGEPERELIKTGRATWEFPVDGENRP